MTQLDVLYRYGLPPTESATMAVARLREVYGIRRLELREAEKTIRIEYDASRLTESVVHQLLLRAGVDIVEEVPLIPIPVPVIEPDPSAAGVTTAQPAK